MIIKDNLILDNEGRTLILRGVNLGGDSKIPFCQPGNEIHENILDRGNKISFTGRPFPLEDARTHFNSLKNAGMTFLRFIVTWEGIEHEGPGIYDEDYLAYLRKILIEAEKEDISVFIDPHQDVWSRWTGGDGAPAWTMEKLGMDTQLFDACGAAVTRQRYEHYHNGKPFPKMLWPSNYNRYAAATMFSLFFAGSAFAPDLFIDGENVQDWLQARYIAAFRHVQRRLKNCAAIKGWGVMNEPHEGFIGAKNIEQPEKYMIPTAPRISPWQAIMAASGYPVKVPVYGLLGRRILRYETINPQGISLFREGYSCPWKQAGVWQDNGVPKLLKREHFKTHDGRAPDFADDFLKPFLVKFITAMKEANEHNFFFIDGLQNCKKSESHPSWEKNDPGNAINAFHWYDGLSLFTKTFRSWITVDPDTKKIIIGKKNVISYFTDCLAKGIFWTKQKMNNMPCLLGEFGLAFDLNNRTGFKRGYRLHEEALSMYYDALDANLLHSTIWNYTACNTNKYGDGWNDEDLSIFSEGMERAAAGWKRPYPMAAAGRLHFFKWNGKRKEFILRFLADSSIKAPTIIYLPSELFDPPPKIEFKNAAGTKLRTEYRNDEQRLFIFNGGFNGETLVKITCR